MSRRYGSSLSIAQGADVIEDKAAAQKDSAIDKLFCSNFERMAEIRYNLASNKSRYLLRYNPPLNRAADRETALR
jgi:hypothetical protein